MRRVTALLLGALVASMFGPAPAGAAEFVVHPGESIQAALQAAPPGSTIIVKDGVYREAVTLTDDGMDVRASGAVLLPPATPPPPGPCTDPDDPGAFTGFCVAGEVDLDTGVVIDPIEDVRISGFTIRGFGGESGILVLGGEDVRIWHNELVDNGVYGAADFLSTGTVYTDNEAFGNGEAGLSVSSSSDADAKVEDNVTRGSFIGIFIRDADGGRIRENLVEDNCVGVAFLDTEDPLGTASEWRVRDNRIRENNRVCPETEEAPDISGTGIAILGATGLRIEDNRVRRNVPAGPSPFVAGGIVAAVSPDGGALPADNRIRNNVVLDNEPADLRDLGGEADWRDNRCRKSEPSGLCD
jgi:nitrous oxidase accessory protein NosD